MCVDERAYVEFKGVSFQNDWRVAVVMATGFTPVFTWLSGLFKSRDSINLGGVSVIFQCPGFSALEEENSRPDPKLTTLTN